MKRILLILTIAAVGLIACAQTGTGWVPVRAKQNFRDSIYMAKDLNLAGTLRLSSTLIDVNATEFNILNGALVTTAELNYLVGTTSSVQTQLGTKQATLVSGTNIKTVNGETLLGSGNIVIEGGEGGSMVYPGAGIPISTGTAWSTSITNNSVNWDSAYVARLRWSGTATGLTASTARTSLGGTTIGQSMFMLSNPSAITFPRFNADNTVSALTAANFKTALSLTATDVSLGNVTNESKATMFTSPTFTGHPTLEGVTATGATGTGNLVFSASPTFTGTVTGTFSGNLTGNVTGTASLVTGFTRNSGALTLSGGHGITLTTTATTAVTLPTTGTLATLTNINDSLTARIGAGVELSDVAVMLTDSLTQWVTVSQLSDSLAAFSGGISEGTVAGMINDTIVARLSVAVEGVILADSTGGAAGNYMPRLQTSNLVSDTITARIAAATVGVAAADSNIYAGYTTRTYVESLLGSGSGLSAERLPFIIGTTTGAPSAADSIVVHSAFEGKHIDIYRDGAKQYQNFTATNTVEGFRVEEDTIYVNPVWQAGEQILVDIIQPILWSYLSLEGEESSLLDSLRGYWKLDETSGTLVTDAAGIQNGTRSAGVGVGAAGKLGYANTLNLSADVINISYNTNTVPKGADFSFAAWIKLDSLPSVAGHNCYVFQQNVGSSPWSGHWMHVASADNKIVVASRNTAGTAHYVYSTAALEVDIWYHVVFVNPGDGQDLILYVNGSDVSASADTFSGTILEGLSNTCIGNAYGGAGTQFEGTIDSPAIWGRVLTSGEVTSLYNSGNGRTHPFN